MKSKIIKILAVFIVISSIVSCGKIIAGKGPMVSQFYEIKNFDNLSIGTNAEVKYIQDSIYSVEIQAQSNVLEHLKVSKTNSTLEIDIRNIFRLGNYKTVQVIIHAPRFVGCVISGSAKVAVTGKFISSVVNLNVTGSGDLEMDYLQCSNCYASVSGSGSILISGGNTENLNLDISGSGEINAESVLGTHVNCNLTGSGRARVWADKTLNVKISGSGGVWYAGNPTIETKISGSGRLHKI